MTLNPDLVRGRCGDIEAALSLCYHVSAKHLRQVPEQYAACFATLRDAGILTPELTTRLQAMARFRNLLVHVYARVEPTRIHEILREHLGDLRAFAQAVAALVAE